MAMTEGEIAAEQGLISGDFRAAQQEDMAMQNPELANANFMEGVPPQQAQEAMMMNMQQNPEEQMEGIPRPDDYGEDIPPEIMQQMMMGQGQMQPQEPPNPLEVLLDVLLSYMDYTIGIKDDETLNHQVKSDILAKMATALSSLVPLLENQAQTDLMVKQAEMQMKQQEHQMNMEMKQMEMQMKMQEHQLKLKMQEETNQQKIQQLEIQHQQKLVQSEETHKTQTQRQKQAAQLKHSNKDVSN